MGWRDTTIIIKQCYYKPGLHDNFLAQYPFEFARHPPFLSCKFVPLKKKNRAVEFLVTEL